MAAKDVRYTRGAGGKFTGSTGGGGGGAKFALTGANKAGGKRAIIARARLRLQESRLRDRAQLTAEAKTELRGKALAKALERHGKLRERLKRNLALHQREVARAESGRAPQRNPQLKRMANPGTVELPRVKFIGGNERKPRYVAREIVKRTPAEALLSKRAHAQDAEFFLGSAKRKLERAAGEKTSSAELRQLEKRVATRQRALANRLKALRRAQERA